MGTLESLVVCTPNVSSMCLVGIWVLVPSVSSLVAFPPHMSRMSRPIFLEVVLGGSSHHHRAAGDPAWTILFVRIPPSDSPALGNGLLSPLCAFSPYLSLRTSDAFPHLVILSFSVPPLIFPSPLALATFIIFSLLTFGFPRVYFFPSGSCL